MVAAFRPHERGSRARRARGRHVAVARPRLAARVDLARTARAFGVKAELGGDLRDRLARSRARASSGGYDRGRRRRGVAASRAFQVAQVDGRRRRRVAARVVHPVEAAPREAHALGGSRTHTAAAAAQGGSLVFSSGVPPPPAARGVARGAEPAMRARGRGRDAGKIREDGGAVALEWAGAVDDYRARRASSSAAARATSAASAKPSRPGGRCSGARAAR